MTSFHYNGVLWFFSGQGSSNRNLIFFTSLFVVVQKDSKFTKKSFFNTKLSKKGYPYLITVLSLFIQSQGDNTFQVFRSVYMQTNMGS